ncbi:hypothetical protein E4U55_003185 [Claviceps digitariae]|nr:hypothetical protein E4U55_003185 [Claviceps digitariae]
MTYEFLLSFNYRRWFARQQRLIKLGCRSRRKFADDAQDKLTYPGPLLRFSYQGVSDWSLAGLPIHHHLTRHFTVHGSANHFFHRTKYRTKVPNQFVKPSIYARPDAEATPSKQPTLFFSSTDHLPTIRDTIPRHRSHGAIRRPGPALRHHQPCPQLSVPSTRGATGQGSASRRDGRRRCVGHGQGARRMEKQAGWTEIKMRLPWTVGALVSLFDAAMLMAWIQGARET